VVGAVGARAARCGRKAVRENSPARPSPALLSSTLFLHAPARCKMVLRTVMPRHPSARQQRRCACNGPPFGGMRAVVQARRG